MTCQDSSGTRICAHAPDMALADARIHVSRLEAAGDLESGVELLAVFPADPLPRRDGYDWLDRGRR